MVHKNSWAKIEKNCTWPMFVRYSVSSFSLLLCWRISIHLSCLQKWVSASSAVCVLEITEVLYHHPSPRISLPPLPPKKPPPPWLWTKVNWRYSSLHRCTLLHWLCREWTASFSSSCMPFKSSSTLTYHRLVSVFTEALHIIYLSCEFIKSLEFPTRKVEQIENQRI